MKRLKLIFPIAFLVATLTACNYQVLDTTYDYNYAYILLPNGECVEGKVDSWLDYTDGDQLQIVIDGVTYLTDTTRAVLVKSEDRE